MSQKQPKTSFKVPEQFRLRQGEMGSDESFGNNGYFIIPWQPQQGYLYKNVQVVLACIASDCTQPDAKGFPRWEHVSVHAQAGNMILMPSWPQMEAIRVLFWGAESTVMQLHVPRSQWIDCHPATLHLWVPKDWDIILPPREFV